MGDSSPKMYKTRYIQPGLISYMDEGRGILLVGQDALDKMRNSFLMKPVFDTHKDIEADEAYSSSTQMQSAPADGIVIRTWPENDGWEWAEMAIWDPQTKENIDRYGYSVSCAYDPTELKDGGTHHGINYDGELLNGEYVHMAIVPNPRYEDARIYANSKGGNMAKKWSFSNFLGKDPEKKKIENQAPDDEEKKDESEKMENAENAFVNVNGQDVPMQELMAAYQDKMNAANQAMGMDDEVEMPDGSMVKVSEMVNAYTERAAMQNAEPPTDTTLEKVSEDQDKPMMNSQTQKNENFKKVENAVATAKRAAPNRPTTMADRLKLGKVRYGKIQKGGE